MDAFTGEIRAFTYSYIPLNWALCDGGYLPVSGNEGLYAVIGNTFGGDSTNFRLPNLAGLIPIGAGQGPGLSPRQVGSQTGSTSVTLTPQTMPSHDHPVTARGGAAANGVAAPGPGALLSRPFTIPSSGPSVGTPMYSSEDEINTTLFSGTLGTAGNSQPHDNRQPYLAVVYCICTDGFYPYS